MKTEQELETYGIYIESYGLDFLVAHYYDNTARYFGKSMIANIQPIVPDYFGSHEEALQAANKLIPKQNPR